MGLDQYVVSIDQKFWESIGSPTIEWEEAYRQNVLNGKEWSDMEQADHEQRTIASRQEEVYYFRKHSDLQGWMCQEFTDEGGEGTFNCQSIILTTERLDKLEKALKERSLPHTTGFFFGATNEDYDIPQTFEMIKLARDAIANGKVVFYDSWW